jgi:hypothetical protein
MVFMSVPSLTAVYDWYNNLPEEVQLDLAALSAPIHPDNSMLEHFGTDTLINGFNGYLLGDGLDSKEAFRRTVLIMAVIEFAMADRATSEGWNKSLDFLLDMRNAGDTVARKETIDGMLSKYPSRKEMWLNAAHSWAELKHSVLSRENITRWYTSSLIK